MKTTTTLLWATVLLLFFNYTVAQAQTLTPKKKTQKVIPDIPEFVEVEGGTFKMGSEDYESDEKPIHSVTVRSFSISKYPITVKQYKKFCDATGRSMPEAPSWGWQDDHPIVNVNYNDAVVYCNWLGQEYEGNFRLPTEAEWEFAARGGNKSRGYKYSGSNVLEEVGWFTDNAGGQSQAVGQKKANELGLYDMSGNVWEWCKDWYDREYYSSSTKYSSGPSKDPKGPSSGSDRVMRGGSWNYTARYCRVAFRGITAPDNRWFSNGFRVVLSE